ncbi:PR domain zinc finger protein 13 [Armadillidium nasatum]|uniref:PR domain zinc finger protein 13 n=1 Tax=Armadillidium nasatum TaxID=96803 RepID=A0A5N5ST36_9CRUS|nr:PR domain zinc finger protein 13 [Armadillidium nasatum]
MHTSTDENYTVVAGEDLPAGVFTSIPITDMRNIILQESKFITSSHLTKSHKVMGQVLSVWFSSQLASELGFPFLTFSHIKGSKGDKSLESVFNSNLSLSLAFSPKILKEDPLDLGNKSLNSKSNCNSIKEISCSSSKLKSNVEESSNGNRHALSAFKPVSSNSYKNNNFYREFKAFRPQFRSDFHSHSLNTNIFPFLSSCTPVPLLPSLTKDPSPTILSSTANPEVADWQRLYRNSSLSTTINSKLIDTSKTSILNSIPSTSASDPCAEVETLVSNLGRGKGGHLCLYCGKVYSRKYGLKIHIRTHTGYKPLKCRICFRPFGDPSNLNKHVRLHAQGGTPYGCELCGKVS